MGGQPFDADARQRFLDSLREFGRITKACRATPVSRSHIDRVRKAEPDFDEAVEEAIADWRESERDVVRSEVRRRGVEGWWEPVFQKGEQATDAAGNPAVVWRRSDDMLARYASSLGMEEFTEKQKVDANVSHGVLAVPEAAQDSTAWAASVARHEGDGGGEDE